MPVSIAWWTCRTGKEITLSPQSASGWKPEGSLGAGWDLVLLLTAFKGWVLGGERNFSEGKLPVWPYPGFCRLLLCQGRAQRMGCPNHLYQHLGLIMSVGQGTAPASLTWVIYLQKRKLYRAEMPSGASSFLSGKQGPVPMTQTRYLEPGQLLLQLLEPWMKTKT